MKSLNLDDSHLVDSIIILSAITGGAVLDPWYRAGEQCSTHGTQLGAFLSPSNALRPNVTGIRALEAAIARQLVIVVAVQRDHLS